MIYLFIILFLIIIVTILFISWFIFFMRNIDEIYEPSFTNIKTECKYRRWGCCNDKLTPKLDPDGTNCRGF